MGKQGTKKEVGRWRYEVGIFLFLLLTSYFTFLPSSYSSPTGTIENYEGYKAYENHQYDKAQEHFAKGLVENPTDFKSAYNLGNSYYRGGAYTKAAES